MNQEFSLSEKNAIVTGGSRGIGLATAAGFVAAGATVTICGRNQVRLDAAIAELNIDTDRIQAVEAHVGRSEDLDRLVDAAENKFGSDSVLVNNAGTNPYFGPIMDADDGAWEKTLSINLSAPFRLSKVVARRLQERQNPGAIINIASVAGIEASPNMGIYSVSKAGLIMLTKVMARECGAQELRVNCICPGLIKTKLSEGLWSDEEYCESLVARKALGRIGLPHELVGAAIFLASDASSFVTGAILPVDGGMTI